MTKTKTAETVHGSVEYETVDCDSCGSEIIKEDARPFKIGNKKGKACEHCVREGPISFPEKTRQCVRVDDFEAAVYALLFQPFILVMMAINPQGEYDNGYIKGSIATTIWFSIPLILWWLL